MIIKVPTQSPETSDTEAAFYTPPKNHPLWTEGSVGSAAQLLKGRRPTFVTCLLERTCSLSRIFHPDYLIRERHPVLQERKLSLQSDSLDCSFYVVDLHYRSLVKLGQESQIPPPLWRGPSEREHLPTHPTNTPLHIQLPQKVTDSYKLVYISHPARGDSDSGEHSPADSQDVNFHPGSALRKAHSLEHIDIKARRGLASREHSLAKHSGTKDLPCPAHNLKDYVLHIKKVLLVEALTQGIAQQQNLLQVLIVVLHIVAHIELHIKVILLVEALIQGIAQQHTQVVCQILQIKLRRPILKAITHQGTSVTTLQQPHQDRPLVLD